MRLLNLKIQDVIARRAYSILCYIFLFLSVILFFGSLPYAEPILNQISFSTILLIGFLSILLRKDFPKLSLTMPLILYAVNEWMTCFAYAADNRIYVFFQIMKAVAGTVMAYYGTQIVKGNEEYSMWKALKGFILYFLFVAIMAEMGFRVIAMDKDGIRIDLYGLLNRAYAEMAFVGFGIMLVLPKKLILNRKKFFQIMELLLMSTIARVVFILVCAFIIKELPNYHVIISMLVPGIFLIAEYTHTIAIMFQKSSAVPIKETSCLYYSEEMERVSKRISQILDMLCENEKLIKDLRHNTDECYKKQLDDCLSDLKQEKYFLQHCTVEEDELDDIEREIEEIMYLGKRGIGNPK